MRPAEPPAEHGRASAAWLALREPVDAAARSVRLLDDLLPLLDRPGHRAGEPLVVHDLGSGTGSQRRWLAPWLRWAQRWVEHDRDAALLGASPAPSQLLGFIGSARAIDRAEPTNPSGWEVSPVADVRSCSCDLAELTAAHLVPADLVTASALLDVLTGPAVDRLVAACVQLRVPLLLSLSVVGRVRFTPPATLDVAVLSAFNDHQRRPAPAGQLSGGPFDTTLLGPDAVPYATAKLHASGATVRSAPTPWRLGPAAPALTAAWFTGWLDAAVEQQPALAAQTAGYREWRLAEIAAGRVEVVVEHTDLLAWWP